MSILDQINNYQYGWGWKGGGIRGIVSACQVKSLVAFLGVPFLQAFGANSMMGGTSTGALECGAIAAGLSPDQMLDLYMTKTPQAFVPEFFSTEDMVLRGYRFDSKHLFGVLQESLIPALSWTMNDCPIPILINASGRNPDTQKRCQWYFTQDRPQNGKYTGEVLLLHAMTASSAASTYFSQWYVPPANGHIVGWCKDGGVGILANPIHQLAAEMFRFGTFDPSKTRMICLGTGHYDVTDPNPPKGILATISDAIDSMLDASDDEQTDLVRWYYPNVPLSVLDVSLASDVDEADLSARDSLLALGTKAAAETDWEKVLGLVSS